MHASANLFSLQYFLSLTSHTKAIFMNDKIYQTKYISLIFFATGRVQLCSDGWVKSGDYSLAETNEILNNLSQCGWTLVGSCDQKHTQGVLDAMDLYFRRELDELN